VVLDYDVEETVVSGTGGVSTALVELVLLFHVEHEKRSILAWLPSPSDFNSQ